MPETDQDQEVNRIVKRLMLFKNPFDVIGAAIDDTPEVIHKKYKKLALIVHPDKCKAPNAFDAFSNLNNALKILQKEEEKNKYIEIMKKAEDEIKEEWSNKGRKRRRESDEQDFKSEVQKRTQKILIELEYKAKRAEEFKLKNELREKEEEMKLKEEAKKQAELEKEWEQGRIKRVESWREFQSKGPKKLKKTKGLKPPKVKLNDSGRQ